MKAYVYREQDFIDNELIMSKDIYCTSFEEAYNRMSKALYRCLIENGYVGGESPTINNPRCIAIFKNNIGATYTIRMEVFKRKE